MLRNPTRPDWSDNPATAFRLVRMAGGAVRMRAGADGDADDSESSSESEQRRTADGVVARDPFDVFVVRPFPSWIQFNSMNNSLKNFLFKWINLNKLIKWNEN